MDSQAALLFAHSNCRSLCALVCKSSLAKGESAFAVETIQLPNGGCSVGELNNERQPVEPHGAGEQFRADGSGWASGQWRDGELHGRGDQFFPNGNRYEGEFVDGEFSGLGALTWTDGRVYEGEFKEGGFNGLGVEWDAKGEDVRCGRWADDKLVESRPVPRSKIPFGSFLSAAGERHSCADHRAALPEVGSRHSR